MAAISSNTDVALSNTKILWGSTGSWTGGVVPTITDDVTITGTKTTINQGSITKWTGTITITVASTSGFPSVGYFYTYTNYGDYVKVNYTGTTSTTFTGCSVDYTDPLCNWKMSTAVAGTLPTYYRAYNSVIGNGYNVYGPTPTITIPKGYIANVSTMIVSNGGSINIEPGGRLNSNNWITLRDGRFTGSGNTGNVSVINVSRLESSGVGYFQTENYTLSVLDLDGGETRSYATLNVDTNVGNTSISINPVQGSFEVGDEITIYDNYYPNNRTFMIGYRDWTDDPSKYQDEGLDVVGKNGNQLWIARKNAAKAKVVSSITSGSQKVLTVDKHGYISQMKFRAGDKVVINNKEYLIDKVADSDYQLAYYNFQTGSTLSDFLIDYTGYANWAIDANGAYTTVNTINFLVNKNIFRREIIIESEISPWSGYTDGSGTRGTDQIGLLFNFDPSPRNYGRNPANDGAMSGYWLIAKDSDNATALASRSSFPGFWMDMSLDTKVPSWKTICQSPAKYRIENRDMIIKAFINGEQVGERFDGSGAMKGLAGVYTWNNTYTHIKSITYKAPTQDLYITTTDSFNANDVVTESGTEVFHWAESRVLKIASKVTGLGTHDDLMFAYRGMYDPGVWPIVRNYNTTQTSGNLMFLNDHNFATGPDYYLDLGTTANANVVIDMTTQRTFTHVAYTPRVDDTGNAAGTIIKGVWIQGSNDNVTYTTIYGPIDDTKRFCNPQSDAYGWYNQMGMYYTGSQTYRYLKFIVNGNNGSSNSTLNRLIKLGVFNFASNNYTVQINNTSDFAIGDTITFLTHAPYTNVDDYHHYQAVKAGQDPANYYHTSNTHSTITNIVGNTLYLDRPINYGFLEGDESVVKINRNFRIEGSYSTNGETKWQKPFFKVNNGGNLCQIRNAKNVHFFNVGSSRLSGTTWSRGVDFGANESFNGCILDGVSVQGYNNSDANGLTFFYGHGVCRNGFVGNSRDYRPYYGSSRSSMSTFNMKISNVFRFRPEDPQGKVTSYNEVAGCYIIQPYVATNSTWYNNTKDGTLRRNNFHGIYNINGFSSGAAMQNDSMDPVFINEYNRIYACNYNAFNGNPTPEVSIPFGMDIHAEHPGMRLSQYRNEQYLGWYNVPADLSIPNSQLKQYMRADYDICNIADYNIAIKRADWDFVRVHEITNDQWLHLAALSVFCKAPVTIQIYVEFEYRMPMRLQKIQNGSGNYGKLALSCVQNGSFVSGYPIYLPLPTDDGWVKYSTTINTIPAAYGQVAAFISRNAMMTFCDFRYGRAYVKTNNPESVYTMVNSFDFNKYFNLTNDKKHIVPLTTSPNIVKGVKF